MSGLSTPGGHVIERSGVRLHFLRSGPRGAPLVLLHGLSANAQCFAGLMRAGLDERHDVIRVDLRGRGQSDQPDGPRYSMQEHAEDVLAVMDAAGLDDAVIVGHSFGGLVTMWLAANHPARVRRQVLIDISGPTIENPEIMRLLQPSLERLDRDYPSLEGYLDRLRAAPIFGDAWCDEIADFYRADVAVGPGGVVRPRTTLGTIQHCLEQGRREDWAALIARAKAPALVLHASGAFGPPGSPPLVLRAQADDLVASLPDARLVEMPGNHLTMVFGDAARAVVAAIEGFAGA
jgi:pimeloyl-ACP methyl ester carboxylesterase